MTILYFCDYKEEKKNIYYKELSTYSEDIYSIKFDTEWNPAELLMNVMQYQYDLIVGHGFGGLFALYLGRATNVKTILINPAYPANWQGELSDYKYKELIEKNIKTGTERIFLKNIYVILSRDDDIKDTSMSNKYFIDNNCFYVDGGHVPYGEDFSRIFKRIVFGESLEDSAVDTILEKRKDEETYDLIKEFAMEKIACSLLYLHTYFEESSSRRLSKMARRVCNDITNEDFQKKIVYMSVEQMDNVPQVRESFSGIDILIVDHITDMFLTDMIKRSLWIACCEVLENDGRVLLLADGIPSILFKEGEKILDLIYTGYSAFFDDGATMTNVQYRNTPQFAKYENILIDDSSHRDRRPYSDLYREIIIDELNTNDGNIVIKWHSPRLRDQVLYVFFKDGNWYIDENDGYVSKERVVKILETASLRFVETAKEVEHDGQKFLGW